MPRRWHFDIDNEEHVLESGSKWALTSRPGEGPWTVFSVDTGKINNINQGLYLIELMCVNAEKNYSVEKAHVNARAFFNGVATPWPEVTSDRPASEIDGIPHTTAESTRPRDFLDQFLETAPIDQALGALRYLILSNMAKGDSMGEIHAKLYLDRLNEYRQSKGLTY